MRARFARRHSITWRLIQLFIILLILFCGCGNTGYSDRCDNGCGCC